MFPFMVTVYGKAKMLADLGSSRWTGLGWQMPNAT
jgi:hypothetical protein